MLDISIFILSFNRAGFLREAVASVLAQSQQPQLIAIFDNGSPASVLDSVRDFVELDVKWIGTDYNHGSEWNFRRAFKSAESKYFMVLHDDDRLDPFFLERQFDFLERNDSVSAVSCNGYLIDFNGLRLGSTLAPVRGRGLYEYFWSGGDVAMKYASNSCIPTSPTIYRTAMAHSVPFRDDFGKVQDAVFFCDLTKAGPVAYLFDPLYECRIHPGQDSMYFPADLMNKLESFFEQQVLRDESLRPLLLSLLIQQHTVRNLKLMFVNLKNCRLHAFPGLAFDSRFSVSLAFNVVLARIVKYLRKITRRFY